MIKKKIKNTDLSVAPINFERNGFGWMLNEKKSFDILNKFVCAGFDFIDTAYTYSWWVKEKVDNQSEEIIGK